MTKVAIEIGVSNSVLSSWENNKTSPSMRFYPKIITFLGYDPLFNDDGTLPAMIENYRRKHGLYYNLLGELIPVSGNCLNRFMRGGKLNQSSIKKIQSFFENLEASD
jgi:transcriptional regulator with XRE-family HTH domain